MPGVRSAQWRIWPRTLVAIRTARRRRRSPAGISNVFTVSRIAEICHQFGGSASKISCASLASAKTSLRLTRIDEGRFAELVKFGKLGPQDLVDKPLRRPDHDRVAPLPIIPVGLHAIASAQGRATPAYCRNNLVAKCYMNMKPLYHQHISETKAVA
jgi:hypothetical protein